MRYGHGENLFMNTEKIPGPSIYQEAAKWYQSESLQTLRDNFIELIHQHDVPYAENILKTNDWVNYCYYCSLVHSFVADPSALIID